MFSVISGKTYCGRNMVGYYHHMTFFTQSLPHPAPFTGSTLDHLQDVLDSLPPLRFGDDCPDPCCTGEMLLREVDDFDFFGTVLACDHCGAEA